MGGGGVPDYDFWILKVSDVCSVALMCGAPPAKNIDFPLPQWAGMWHLDIRIRGYAYTYDTYVMHLQLCKYHISIYGCVPKIPCKTPVDFFLQTRFGVPLSFRRVLGIGRAKRYRPHGWRPNAALGCCKPAFHIHIMDVIRFAVLYYIIIYNTII